MHITARNMHHYNQLNFILGEGDVKMLEQSTLVPFPNNYNEKLMNNSIKQYELDYGVVVFWGQKCSFLQEESYVRITS